MRALKFRVWNNRYNEFVRPDYGLIGFCYPLDGRISVLTTSGERMEDCILEQYTGLKDKNGKEIYEGDIVKYEGDSGCFGVVEYDAPEFYLNADVSNWARMIIHGGPYQTVIGNIHENPELWEEK